MTTTFYSAVMATLLCLTMSVYIGSWNLVRAHQTNKYIAAFAHPRHQTKPLFSKRGPIHTQFTKERARGSFTLHHSDGDDSNQIDTAYTKQASLLHRRQFFASVLLATQLPLFSNAASSQQQQEILTTSRNYQQSPINRRSGITLSEPEIIYPLNFITYLARFLLVFDPECQAWWYAQASAIPAKSSKEDVDRMRLDQFGQFAASVEVGLVDFEGDGGPGILLEELVKRYADISLEGSPSGKDPFSSLVTGNSTQPIQQEQQQKIRRKKEALRQIALMFSLLKEYQPVELITQLLAADDDAKIDKVIITDGGTGYLPPDIDSVKVTFPNPPTFGTAFGGSVARGKAILRETGRILKVEVIDGGSGYTKPPVVEISHPKILDSQSRALAKAILGKGNAKGSIERIEVTNFGTGFYSAKDNIDVKIISPPDSTEGKTATARAILEYQVVGVEIFDPGRGYAAERPIAVTFDPPPADGGRTAAAISYPAGKSTIFKSFLSIDDRYASNTRPSDTESPSCISPSWVQGPTSLQLLTLLPSGVGLEYDASLKRYVLATAQADQFNDSLYGTLEGMSFKPLNPIFGVRGRSPIEREKSLNASTVIRFIASGAVCSSVAHLVLTPIDVVKTKVQTKPDVYSGGIVNTFKKVLDEEGSKSFFTGWEPTFLGFFLTGGVSFFFTEYFRRLFTSLMVTNLMTQAAMSEIAAQAVTSSYEIPIVAASAATSGFLCCFILSPFDAVRIRTVTQPDFADSPFGVLPRIIREEGVLSLFSALNACILKEVPYNVVKFLVFDGFTQWAYECIPAAQEDIRLSLTISLVGGTCGGIAASIVSNPADVIVSEMKKSKSDMGPLEAASVLKQRAGWKAFSCGLQLRMIFYSLLVSLQFLLYDTVRIALGVGSDDMKLFLNVLGAALKETSDL